MDAPELTLQGAYEAWAGELVRFATVLVGPSDAADVVADAFAALLRDDVAWATIERPRSYLFGVVANQARMRHRSLGRRRRREAYVDATTTRQPTGSPSDEVAATEALGLLAVLSPQQRAVTYLAYWEDWSIDEIASHLGVSDGTVRRQLARARAALREELS